MLLLTVGNHLPLFLPENQVVVPLNRNKFFKSFPLRQGVGLAQLPCKAVGNADIPGLARLHRLGHALQNLLNRRKVVPHVADVQIHIIHTQIFQAGVQPVQHVLLPGNALLNFLLGAGRKFRGHHHVLPPAEIPQGPAHVLFAGASLITDGRVVKVDSAFQSPADNLPGILSGSVQRGRRSLPNPMQPMQIRETRKSVLPKLPYRIFPPPAFFLKNRLCLYYTFFP